MLPHSRKCPSRFVNACKPNRSSTPASIAAARVCGIIFISLANSPVKPQSKIRALAKIKIPMVSASVTPCKLVASRAAPGVDQAVNTGALYHRESANVLTPMPIPSAVIQPAIW
ncbi:hypothetical protein D3C86_1757820 [compost metagenome]